TLSPWRAGGQACVEKEKTGPARRSTRNTSTIATTVIARTRFTIAEVRPIVLTPPRRYWFTMARDQHQRLIGLDDFPGCHLYTPASSGRIRYSRRTWCRLEAAPGTSRPRQRSPLSGLCEAIRPTFADRRRSWF